MDSGVVPISLDQALSLLERPVSGRYACITFDDACADVATNAAPILREYGLSATIFAPTAIVDGNATYSWYRGDPPPALTWDELSELVAGGLFDVQAHSRTHPRLPALDDERASEEIQGSKLDIERRLGREVTSFCYPAGLYGERDVELVRAAGYSAGITTRSGINRGGTAMGELRRTMIGWHDGRADFEAKLAGLLDRPATITEWMQRRRTRARVPA
jgi:peptidoglycan/xylan/chitin deacetylase (PgdA/CDA1 family)